MRGDGFTIVEFLFLPTTGALHPPRRWIGCGRI
jgi:hypothetical protein